MRGSRREDVELFLWGTLQANSERLYLEALRNFRTDCAEQDIDFARLDCERQDWLVAEYLLEQRDKDVSLRQKGVYLVAALAKVNPARKDKISF